MSDRVSILAPPGLSKGKHALTCQIVGCAECTVAYEVDIMNLEL